MCLLRQPGAQRITHCRWGLVSFADSLDCVGILSKDVESAESVFGLSGWWMYASNHTYRKYPDSLNIYDPRDPTAVTQETRERALKSVLSNSLDSGSLSGLRIGVPSVRSSKLQPSTAYMTHTGLLPRRVTPERRRPSTCFAG